MEMIRSPSGNQMGLLFLNIRRGKGEEIALWKAVDAMGKAIYCIYWQYLKAFGENNIHFGKKSASTATCFRCLLLGILFRDYANRVVLVGIFGTSQPIFAPEGIQNVHQEYPCCWVVMSELWRENYSGLRNAEYPYENSMSLMWLEVWFHLRTPPWEKAE